MHERGSGAVQGWCFARRWEPRRTLEVVRAARRPSGWLSRHGQTPDGAVETEQRIELVSPVVEFSELGAHELARAYWEEVERSTLRFVRRAGRRRGVQLCVLGRGPALLAFGSPEIVASATLVAAATRSLAGSSPGVPRVSSRSSKWPATGCS